MVEDLWPVDPDVNFEQISQGRTYFSRMFLKHGDLDAEGLATNHGQDRAPLGNNSMAAVVLAA